MRHVHSKDLQKIIEKERLVFSNISLFERFLEYFILILTTGLPFLIGLESLISKLEEHKDTNTDWILCILAFSFFVLILYSRIQATKLLRITGANPKTNKKIILEYAAQFDWTVEQNTQEMIILHKSWSWTSTNWGKDIFVIFDKNDLLVCSIHYGKNYVISPFHWFANRSYENHIKRVLSEASHSSD